MKEAARLPCCQRVRRGACRSLARDDRRARDADNSRSVPLALPSALSSCLSVALLTPPHPALMVLPFFSYSYACERLLERGYRCESGMLLVIDYHL